MWSSLLEWTKGKRTYALVLAGVVLWLGWVLGWWTMDQVDQLFVLLGTLGVAALRAGMK